MAVFELPSAKDLSEPYPCQDSACGCKTAEQCWTSCCCHSPKERGDWAKKKGIKPPGYAVLPREEDRESDIVERLRNKISLRTQQAAKCGSATDGGVASCSTDDGVGKKTVIKKKRGVVLSILALRCQGKSTLFAAFPWAVRYIPTDNSVVFNDLGAVYSDEQLVPLSLCMPPDTPPPRPFLVDCFVAA